MEAKQQVRHHRTSGLKVRTAIRAGKLATNHSGAGLKVRTAIRAGKLATNHNRRMF
jgi:hypothetical protein